MDTMKHLLTNERENPRGVAQPRPRHETRRRPDRSRCQFSRGKDTAAKDGGGRTVAEKVGRTVTTGGGNNRGNGRSTKVGTLTGSLLLVGRSASHAQVASCFASSSGKPSVGGALVWRSGADGCPKSASDADRSWQFSPVAAKATTHSGSGDAKITSSAGTRMARRSDKPPDRTHARPPTPERDAVRVLLYGRWYRKPCNLARTFCEAASTVLRPARPPSRRVFPKARRWPRGTRR